MLKATALDGLFYSSTFQADRGIDFNGFYWDRPGGAVVIDPMHDLAELPGADPAWVLLTSADHLRAAPAVRERFGALVLAPRCDEGRLRDAAIDGWFGEDEPLPTELAADIDVHWIHGGKTAAEPALLLKPLRAIVFGDVVRAHASGVLRLLPPDKLRDPDAVIRDVQALAPVNFTAILLGDGDCMFTGAKGAFLAFARDLAATRPALSRGATAPLASNKSL